jgi:hypothetical protein
MTRQAWDELQLLADLERDAGDMWNEVLDTYFECRAAGDSIEEACRCARREWDI